MTTLLQIINNLDRNNPKLESDPDWEELSSYLGVGYLPWSDNTRLKSYWITVWNCTDTWVGIKAYFLDDELICVSSQKCRKCNTDFGFISKDTALRVKNYLESLLEENEPFTVDLIEDLNSEVSATYKLEFSSQILLPYHKYAIYEPTGENIEIVNVIDRGYTSQLIVVKFPDTSLKRVNVNTLLFKMGQCYFE